MTNQNRYSRIILEDLKHKIKIIAEGHALQVKKLDTIQQQVDAIELRLDLAGIPKKI